MSKVAIELYSYAGSSIQAQLAHRADSETWWQRRLDRDPRFGYRWTRWERTQARPRYVSNGDDPASYSETGSGWVLSTREANVRLPAA